MSLPVSIVIPSHNRSGLIVRMVPSYLRQGCAELIVVDDASFPAIAPIRENPDTRVRIVRLEGRVGTPEARMIGVRAASQKYIFFGEDDVFLDQGCIQNLVSLVGSGQYNMVAPQCIMVKALPDDGPVRHRGAAATRADQVIDYQTIQIAYSAREPAVPIEVPWLHATALMSRESILAIGFDPAYKGNAYREETDFFVRARAAGHRLAFVPGPPAFHYKGDLNVGGGQHAGGEIRNLLRCEYWVARNNIYFLRKNAVSLRLAGVTAHPYRGTALLLIRRAAWYWHRLWRKLIQPSAVPSERHL
jgi:GT2 family glycosyltransferase